MPATPSGEMRQAIMFQRATQGRGALGAKTAQSWAAFGTAKAKVLFGTGSERRAAGVESGTQAATFRVRASALTRGVLVTDRISFSGMAWDITAISQLLTAPAEIEFTAVAARG